MTLRGVLIGCGFFAQNHMRGWADLPGIDIVGVCDLDGTKASAFAETFGAKAWTDPAAMLAEVRPDLTDIATTVPSHRALVELAARHSRLVICQKPMADTLDDARAMVAACGAAGIPLLVHENFRWQRPMRMLRQAIDRGDIGTPRFLRLSFRHGHDIYGNQPYLRTVADLALTDIGLHLFDVARFLMGDIVHVACQTQRRNPGVAGQDAFAALLRHADGAVASVECSFHSHYDPDPFPQTLALVEGDAGTLDLTTGYRLHLHRDGRCSTSDTEPPVPEWGAKPWHLIQDSVLAFQGHVLDVLAGRTMPQPSGAHNAQTLAVTLAAIRSAQTGQSVDMATFDPRGRT